MKLSHRRRYYMARIKIQKRIRSGSLKYMQCQISINSIRIFRVWHKKQLESYYKGKHGVYVFYDVNGQVVYVGESQNLWPRLRDHISGSWPGTQGVTEFFHTVKVYEINFTPPLKKDRDAYYNRKILELYLIKKLKPIRNETKNGFFPHNFVVPSYVWYTNNNTNAIRGSWPKLEQLKFTVAWK
jgi:hypothetical protein